MKSLRTAALGVVCLLVACDTPAGLPPHTGELPLADSELIPPDAVARAADARGTLTLERYAAHVGTGAVVYDFDDLPWDCGWNALFPTDYQGLVFGPEPVRMASCHPAPRFLPEDGISLIPADRSLVRFDPYEIRVTLPHAASSVAVSSWNYLRYVHPEFVAYGPDGAEVGRARFTTLDQWETHVISGGPIAAVGLVSAQAQNFWDDLTVEYVNDPQTKDDCKNGGWDQYGFKNQGQCVRFVETGKDSRG